MVIERADGRLNSTGRGGWPVRAMADPVAARAAAGFATSALEYLSITYEATPKSPVAAAVLLLFTEQIDGRIYPGCVPTTSGPIWTAAWSGVPARVTSARNVANRHLH